MSNVNLQYIADSILIERYMGRGMRKEAGIASEVFSFVGNAVREAVSSLWDPERPAASIMALSAKGLLAVFTGGWSILIELICEDVLGINFIDVFDKVKQTIASLFESKQAIKMSNITSAVDSAVSSAGVSNADDGVYADSEYVFKKMSRVHKIIYPVMSNDPIEKQAQLLSLLKFPITLIKGIIKKIVPKALAESFLGKILKFLFVTIATSVAAKIGGKALKTVAPSITNTLSGILPGYQHRLTPTTFGQELMPDDWCENVPQSAIGQRMIDWAFELYPELKSQEAKVKQLAATSSKFQAILSAIKNENSKNFYENLTSMPSKISGFTIKSKADIVNFFIEDIAKPLNL